MNITGKKRIEFQLIRDMMTDEVTNIHDLFRLPNDEGKEQIKMLRLALKKEGTEFDVVFYSPAIRTHRLALALSNPNTSLVEIPELYDPNPKSADPAESSDAKILLEARKRNGYDWVKWGKDKPARCAIDRRIEVVAEKFVVEVKTVLLRRDGDPVLNKLLLRVGVVGHFPYLNVLGMCLAGPSDQRVVLYKIPLAECERFVLSGTCDEINTITHVPLGGVLLQGDPEGLN